MKKNGKACSHLYIMISCAVAFESLVYCYYYIYNITTSAHHATYYMYVITDCGINEVGEVLVEKSTSTLFILS